MPRRVFNHIPTHRPENLYGWELSGCCQWEINGMVTADLRRYAGEPPHVAVYAHRRGDLVGDIRTYDETAVALVRSAIDTADPYPLALCLIDHLNDVPPALAAAVWPLPTA